MEGVWAEADSLLGLMQRGRGACYDLALAQREPAREFVVDCIVDDPRWDHQIEDRSWLYATLVRELGVDLRRLRAAYARPMASTGDSDAWLAVGVLEHLARAGVEGSVSELRHYLRTGRDTELAIDALAAFHDHPEARGLRDEVPAIADDEQPAPGSGPSAPSARLARAAAERQLILSAAAGVELGPPDAGVDDASWEATLLAIAADLLGDAATPLRVRVALRRQLRLLRSPRALAWARANAGMDTDFAYRALTLLCEIGEGGDAGLLSDYLTATRTDSDEDISTQCTLVKGLTRLRYEPAAAMFDVLFDTTVYSYLRERCVVGLSTLATDFAHTRAFECLTDAESGIRAIAIAHVDISKPEARERLARIAGDAMEEEDNRHAAAVRISLETRW